MSRTIWVGAVAYDPKVVTIWEGMRRYFPPARVMTSIRYFMSGPGTLTRQQCQSSPSIFSAWWAAIAGI